MITNNFNKELRGISDALRDLGYTDSTIGMRQRYWKEYCFFHGSLDIDEASMDEFLLKNYGIQSGNINVSKRQYEVRAALRNLLEYRRYGKIRNYTQTFNKMGFIETEERDEIYMALRGILDALPGDALQKDALLEQFEQLRDF